MTEVSITRCLWLSVACGWLLTSLLADEPPFVRSSAAAHAPEPRCTLVEPELRTTLRSKAH